MKPYDLGRSPMLSEKALARVARRAIFLLKRDGWCQGRALRRGARCIHTALWNAARDITGDETSYGDARSYATFAIVRAEYLIDPEGKRFKSIARRPFGGKKYISWWNDKKTTTLDDVIGLLRRVARGERRER